MKDNYLLAITPPKKIADTASKYRLKYDKYTRHSISPHITICPPFFLEGVSEEQLRKLVMDGLLNTPHSEVRLRSIGYFEEGNNVVFFKPDDQSSEYLKNILVKVTKEALNSEKPDLHFSVSSVQIFKLQKDPLIWKVIANINY